MGSASIIKALLYIYCQVQRKTSKKGKTKEHPRGPPSGPYAQSNLSCFLVFMYKCIMHLCILQIISMHKCILSRWRATRVFLGFLFFLRFSFEPDNIYITVL